MERTFCWFLLEKRYGWQTCSPPSCKLTSLKISSIEIPPLSQAKPSCHLPRSPPADSLPSLSSSSLIFVGSVYQYWLPMKISLITSMTIVNDEKSHSVDNIRWFLSKIYQWINRGYFVSNSLIPTNSTVSNWLLFCNVNDI